MIAAAGERGRGRPWKPQSRSSRIGAPEATRSRPRRAISSGSISGASAPLLAPTVSNATAGGPTRPTRRGSSDHHRAAPMAIAVEERWTATWRVRPWPYPSPGTPGIHRAPNDDGTVADPIACTGGVASGHGTDDRRSRARGLREPSESTIIKIYCASPRSNARKPPDTGTIPPFATGIRTHVEVTHDLPTHLPDGRPLRGTI